MHLDHLWVHFWLKNEMGALVACESVGELTAEDPNKHQGLFLLSPRPDACGPVRSNATAVPGAAGPLAN